NVLMPVEPAYDAALLAPFSRCRSAIRKPANSSSVRQAGASSAGSGSGRCGAGHLHLLRAAKELQRRKHQEPRCQPVAFAPILASFRLTTEREQNEAEGESKAASSKAHARNGTEVAVLPGQHRASHEGLQGRGAVIWCVHRDASCHLLCRLSGTYRSDIIFMADRQERHSPSSRSRNVRRTQL
ncbi:MAG TPA: hypothetical protein VED37_11835, partial [Ktedonobacteraceae bacterium]|nr:hypothetical protein [Ktedonobacteraceae bacterium]